MSAHDTRKTVAAVALATILAASPVLPGKARQAGRFHGAFSWLESPITWMAAALGITTTETPAPTGPVPSVGPSDGTDQGWSVDPMGGPSPK